MSSSVWLMSWIVWRRFHLITPWNWNDCRVVRRSCAVGVLMGQGVQVEPLPRRDDAAGGADADHEVEGRLQPLPRPLLADVAVVLHVGAVELQQGVVALRHRAR